MEGEKENGLGGGARRSRSRTRKRNRGDEEIPSEFRSVLKSLRGRKVREGDLDTPIPKPRKRVRRKLPKRMILPAAYLKINNLRPIPKDATLKSCVSGWAMTMAATRTNDFEEMLEIQKSITEHYWPLVKAKQVAFPPGPTFELPASFTGGIARSTSGRATTNGVATTGPTPDPDTSSDVVEV